jgi:hypothetical protein
VANEVAHLKKHRDGSTDVWFAGWRVRFSAAEAVKPETSKEDAPPSSEPAGDKVQVATVDGKTYLRFGAWTMIFDGDREQEPHPQRADPEPAPQDKTRRIRKMPG